MPSNMFDYFTDAQQGRDAPVQPMQPPQAFNPSGVPSYADYLKLAQDAAVKAARAKGFISLGTRTEDAARAAATLNALDAYQKLQAGQTGVQSGQLDLGQTLQAMQNYRKMHGLPPIDANNIPGSYGTPPPSAAPQAPPQPPVQAPGATNMGDVSAITRLADAMPVPVNNLPGFLGGSAPPAAPIAPTPGQPAAPEGDNAIAPFFSQLRDATEPYIGLPKFAPYVNEMLKLGQTGLTPESGLVRGPDGRTYDASSGQLYTGSIPGRFGQRARAEGDEQITTQNSINDHAKDNTILTQNNEAGLQRGTNTLNNNQQFANNIAGKTFEGQQAELKELNDGAQSADRGLNIATQLFNAANGLYTGHGAQTVQDLRKTVLALSAATGIPVDNKIIGDTSGFEQIRFLGQQLVALAGKELSPRLQQQIYQQIAAVKPGEQSSVQGLRDIISKQIIPVLSRTKALAPATADYYNKNPTARNSIPVNDQLPLGNFGVKTDLSKVQPGDYFVDPKTNEILQRPR